MRARKARATRTSWTSAAGSATAISRSSPAARAPGRQHHLHDGDAERQDKGEMSELDDHGAAALPPVARGWVSGATDQGWVIADA